MINEDCVKKKTLSFFDVLRFVAGYWRKVDDGWQWVAGYWAPVNQERPQLLAPPPESLEIGPSVPAPDDGSIYATGSWVWGRERYAWRPGSWRRAAVRAAASATSVPSTRTTPWPAKPLAGLR